MIRVKTESPILFSTPMMEAILAGRKTQTRRVFKGIGKWLPESLQEMRADSDKAWAASGYPERLWVKETFYLHADGSVLFKAGLPGQHPVPPWKPSIFMPRRFCRLTLKVTGVRLERVQDISADDALAEGIDWKRVDNWTVTYFSDPKSLEACIHHTPQSAYRALWDCINAKRGYGWDTNPWVWVISFAVAERSDLCGA
ncbi:MAG: hypothetical protein HZB23_03425 [Deltaproteobacteria bacterium]|nr:hypothetical protein [Deltaproteobacteria bacterium]